MMPSIAAFAGRNQRIRNTLLVNLSLIGVAVVAALFLVLAAAIDKGFTALEDREVQGHIGRVTDFQRTRLRSMVARAKDWAIWDDSYFYAQDFNSRYEASNVNAESFQNALVDGLAVVRHRDGAARAFAFDREKGVGQPGLAASLRILVTKSWFVKQFEKQDTIQAFVTFEGKLYVLAGSRLHRSDGSGASPGFLTFIQQLEPENATQALQVETRLDLVSRIEETIVKKYASTIEIAVPLEGLDGHTIGTIQLKVKRPLSAAASELLLVTFVGVLILIFVLLVVLNKRLKVLVLNPVERLHKHVSGIRATGDLRAIEGLAPNNEFGALQTEFNRMANELQQLRAEVESQSFLLGKSQSAIGLVHNLRNCLSPVKIILETLDQGSASPLPPQAARALRELSDNSIDPERRVKLSQFLSAAHDHVGEAYSAQRQHVREAARNLMTALDSIDAAAQNHRETRFDERCDLPILLSQSANLARYTEGPAVAVDLVSEGHVAARGNRILLAQVLENLVANALEAMGDGRIDNGVIRLEVLRDEPSASCIVTVTDNGPGFGPEIATRLFERGFSTRADKEGGLGLHWCANTISAMGGRLTLESAGAGNGACATICLPLWRDPQNLDQQAA